MSTLFFVVCLRSIGIILFIVMLVRIVWWVEVFCHDRVTIMGWRRHLIVFYCVLFVFIPILFYVIYRLSYFIVIAYLVAYSKDFRVRSFGVGYLIILLFCLEDHHFIILFRLLRAIDFARFRFISMYYYDHLRLFRVDPSISFNITKNIILQIHIKYINTYINTK